MNISYPDHKHNSVLFDLMAVEKVSYPLPDVKDDGSAKESCYFSAGVIDMLSMFVLGRKGMGILLLWLSL